MTKRSLHFWEWRTCFLSLGPEETPDFSFESQAHNKPLQVALMSYLTLIYVFSDTQKWENIRQRILLSFHTFCSWIFPLMPSDAVCLRVPIAVKSNVRSLVRLSGFRSKSSRRKLCAHAEASGTGSVRCCVQRLGWE